MRQNNHSMLSHRHIIPIFTLLIATTAVNAQQYQNAAVDPSINTAGDSRAVNNNTPVRYENYNQPTMRQEQASDYDRSVAVTNYNRTYAPADARGLSNTSSQYASPPQNYDLGVLSGTGMSLAEHRLANPNAYGAASGAGYINPGSGIVAPLYNKSTRRYYYYCTTEETRRKCHAVAQPGAGDNPLDLLRVGDYSYWSTGIPYNYIYSLMNYHRERDLLLVSDNTNKHSNSSQFFSFDGYIVYEKDTVPGVVTITHNAVSLEHPAKNTGRNYYNAMLTDPLLKAIAVYKGRKELHMVRLSPTDKHLSRMVHSGKLMLYDRSYSFLTADNIDNKVIAVNTSTGEKSKVKTGSALTEMVNGIYGTAIPETTSKQDLITMINRLD
jgi:hypothetical protein